MNYKKFIKTKVLLLINILEDLVENLCHYGE